MKKAVKKFVKIKGAVKKLSKNLFLQPVRIHPTYMPKDWYYYGFLYKKSYTEFETEFYIAVPGYISEEFTTRKNEPVLNFELISSVINQVEKISLEQFPKKYKQPKFYACFLTDPDEFTRKIAKKIWDFLQ